MKRIIWCIICVEHCGYGVWNKIISKNSRFMFGIWGRRVTRRWSGYCYIEANLPLSCEMKRIIWCMYHLCRALVWCFQQNCSEKHSFYVWHMRKRWDSEIAQLLLYWGKFAVLNYNVWCTFWNTWDSNTTNVRLRAVGTAHEMHDFWINRRDVFLDWVHCKPMSTKSYQLQTGKTCTEFSHCLKIKENVPIGDGTNSYSRESQS